LNFKRNPCDEAGGFPHPETNKCQKEGDKDFIFSQAIFEYLNVCPGNRPQYIKDRPAGKDWPKTYSYYENRGPVEEAKKSIKD